MKTSIDNMNDIRISSNTRALEISKLLINDKENLTDKDREAIHYLLSRINDKTEYLKFIMKNEGLY